MNEDPIVAEIRRIRDEAARRCGYDIHKMFANIRMREQLEDVSHPLVKNAEAAAKDLIAVKEEPRSQGGA